MGLTTIANRLTPSVPLQITFGAQPVATGTKITTLIGHMAASPGTGIPYQVYNVVNVGDPVAGPAEVANLAGSGAQIVNMVTAFINANAAIASPRNFPQFRVVLLPYGELHFGPSGEALTAIAGLRSDMIVSCYPSGDVTNKATILAFAEQISGIDRDLQGQFGSFVSLASILPLATQVAFADNSRYLVEHCMPDTNTALVPVLGTVAVSSNIITAVSQAPLSITGTVASGSNIITGVSSTAGIYTGASITGTGIPAGAIVEVVLSTSLQISVNATASGASEALVVTNLPTAGIYPGALLTGTGIPALTVVESVTSSTIVMSNSATAAGAAEAISVQNQISQAPEIIASACAAAMMSSAFPYNPLLGVQIGGLVPPQKPSDRILVDPNGSSEQAIAAGLSPLYTAPGNAVSFIRTVTTYTMNGTVPVTAYFDWQDLVVLNDFREECYLVTQNPPFNNNPGGTKASQAIANLLKDEILRVALDFESQGAFQGVKTNAPLFLVQPSSTSRGRFDFQIPVNVIPGLMVIAGNIEAVSGENFGDFTL